MNQLSPNDYPAWAENYISKVKDNVLNTLERQISIISILFKNNIDKSDFAYAEKKWTLKQMLGHLIDTERVLVYRLMAIARGEQQELISFDEDEYVNNGAFEKRNLIDMVNEFEALRTANMYFFKSLTEQQLNRKGLLAGNRPITAKALLFVVAGHIIHHIQILKERYELV